MKEVKVASGGEENGKLQAQVFNLGYDNFLGRMAICRIYEGIIKTSSSIVVKVRTVLVMVK